MRAVQVLRQALMADEPLQRFFHKHYAKDARHFIGHKQAFSVNDFPSLCYVESRSVRGIDSGQPLDVSLVFGVNEPGITNDMFDGVSRLNEIEDLLIAALENTQLSVDVSVVAPFTVKHDLDKRHPFHERAISFELFVATSNADAVLAASKDLS